MSNVKNMLSDWLEDCGYELGYDFDFHPLQSQFKTIKTKRIYRRKYGEWQSKSNNK
jgi:hypothetical protein